MSNAIIALNEMEIDFVAGGEHEFAAATVVAGGVAAIATGLGGAGTASTAGALIVGAVSVTAGVVAIGAVVTVGLAIGIASLFD